MKPLSILAQRTVRSLALMAAMGWVGVAASAELDLEHFALITQRNIFDPNRLPPPVPGRERPRPTVVDSFTLSGTMAYSKGFFAFFNGTSDEYQKVAETGEKIAGFTVTDIGYDAVKLTQEGTEVELKVGMQMRRSSDGTWTPGQASSQGTAAFAANSRGSNFGWNRNDRRRGRNDDNGGQRNWGDNNNNNNNNRWAQMGNGNNFRNVGSLQPAMPIEQPGMSLEAAALDPSDPVARMMARRMQALGGNAAEGQMVFDQPMMQEQNDGNAEGQDRNVIEDNDDGRSEGPGGNRQLESGPLGRRADQGFQPTPFGDQGNEMNFEGNDNTNADNEN